MYVPAGDSTGITQTVYSLTPRSGHSKMLRKLHLRLPACLMGIDPHQLAPGVRWLQRGYRPRLGQIASLPMPGSITTDTDEWLHVDRVAKDIAGHVRERKVTPPLHMEGFARMMWWRQWISERTALPAAIEAAFRSSGPDS
jgi:hypothetical protein